MTILKFYTRVFCKNRYVRKICFSYIYTLPLVYVLNEDYSSSIGEKNVKSCLKNSDRKFERKLLELYWDKLSTLATVSKTVKKPR